MGDFTIRLERGIIASHSVEINGIFKKEWKKEEIEDFIRAKISEINEAFQAEIELLSIEMGKKTRIRIQVLIASVGSAKTMERWSREWLGNHIEKNEACITRLKVRAISPLSGMMNED